MKQYKKSGICIILIIVMLAAASCKLAGNEGTESVNSEHTQEQLDRAGNKVIVPENIESIVSMAPSTTQILVDLGLGDKIIGIDTYSTEVEGIGQALPAFDIMYPDIELLLSLKPDIILVSGMSFKYDDNPFQLLINSGTTMIQIPIAASIEDIQDDILYIGSLTDTSERANGLVVEMKTEISRIQEVAKTIDDKKSIYFEIDTEPNLYSFGSGVFLDEMVTLIGADNICADQKEWISVSEEYVISRNPDVILSNSDLSEAAIDEIMNRNGWSAMDAVKNDQIYIINRDASSIPNHNIMIALREMALAVYPEEFKSIYE